MTVWVSHPTGNPNLRAVLRGLERAGLRPTFFTTVAFPAALMNAVGRLSAGVGRELFRRTFPEIPYARVRVSPGRELVRQLAGRLGLRALVRHEKGLASTDRVYRALDLRVARALRSARRRPSAIYAYEDGALTSFLTARECGVRRIYELPTAYWRRKQELFEEERNRRPEWASTLEGLRDSPAKLERKNRELAEAELAIVPSTFVAESLRLAPRRPRRVAVVPYGCDPPATGPVPTRRRGEPLSILYAGILTQRKGLADLFEALDRLAIPHRLTLAGPCPVSDCRALRRALERLERTWLGAVARPVLMELMRTHHVLVFPSLVEGFGLVLTEAMANGLPFIATTHTAAPELISADGAEGFVVPIRDPDAIAERLTFLYENEDRRLEMAEAAKRRAAELSWRRFEETVSELVRGMLDSRREPAFR